MLRARSVPIICLLVSACAGCETRPHGCRDEACSGNGLVLRAWIQDGTKVLTEIQVFDVSAAADRAMFETEISAAVPAVSEPLLARVSTPLCSDTGGVSAIDADLPDDLSGKTVAVVALATASDCFALPLGCTGTFFGYAIATLGDGCQDVMIPTTAP